GELILNALTRKETRVLQLLSEGYSNSAMSEKLFVSDSTVRTHLRNINSKLNASSRTQAVAIARRYGLI
ncbi:MAG: LuxR C-terminal-related transcriptional regulator, partial [Marinobacter sp.]